ncbi:MAG: C-GCAxxG-C-C family protein [Muribaculaceae bacterium]
MKKEQAKMLDVEERAALGAKLFLDGYNCSQSVVAAFADVYGLDNNYLKLASSFGGGMGRLRMTCGACTGMFMLAGLHTGSSIANDLDARTRNYDAVQQLGKRFEDENGSMICADLLGLRAGIVEPPKPSERTQEYYRKRPCKAMVESACRIYAKFYNEQIALLTNNSSTEK